MLKGRIFGIPKTRTVKVDPFEGLTRLIVKKAPEKKGETFKFELTKEALKQLDLVRESSTDEKLVSFSFTEDTIILGNTTSLKGKIDSKTQYMVSMQGIFSNKDTYKYITNLLNLDNSIDNILLLTMLEDEELPLAIISIASEEVEDPTWEEPQIPEQELLESEIAQY